MAKRNKRKRLRRYTPEQKYFYYQHRQDSPDTCGIVLGSPRWYYSSGFIDGWGFSRKTSSQVEREDGVKARRSYDFGYSRGNKASRKYEKRTGKSAVLFKILNKQYY